MNPLMAQKIRRVAFSKTYVAIAKEYGTTPARVSSYLRNAQIITEGNFGSLPIDEVWHRLHKGQSFISIANEFGYNADRLRDWFWKNGEKYFKTFNPTTQKYE